MLHNTAWFVLPFLALNYASYYFKIVYKDKDADITINKLKGQ